MVRRPRCRSCGRRIWPWQRSGGWGMAGTKDNDRERSFMKHMACMIREHGEQQYVPRPAEDPKCHVCGGPVNGFKECLSEIWSGRNRH